jgi:hypothetical protein
MTKKISKKNLLHDEVQSRICKMLIDKNILYKNNPVDNTETNARLIKSFLYRKISSKYPKYNSFSKISTINNLDDNELSNLLLDLPNLDEWYASIQQSVEKKKLEKKNQPHVSDEEEVVEVVDEISATVETVKTIVETNNVTVETVKTIVETNNATDNATVEKVNATERCTYIKEDDLTESESNELNENFTLTDKIFIAVKKIVIVYAFYRLVRYFV